MAKYYMFGSVDDIRKYLKSNPLKTVEEAEDEINCEKWNQNRSSAIKIFEAQKKKLLKPNTK